MIRTVNFYGPLKEETGLSTIDLDINSPRELFSALRSQVKNFRQMISTYPMMSILLSNKDKSKVEHIDSETFNFPLSQDAEEIHLVPKIEGAGTGAEVAWFMLEADMTYTAAVVATVALNIAIAVTLSYVASILAPSPSTTDGGAGPAQRPSFLFNGAVNVVEQGYPVPLVYGIHTTGSVVVSVGVDVAELPYTSSTDATVPVPAPVEPSQWTQ